MVVRVRGLRREGWCESETIEVRKEKRPDLGVYGVHDVRTDWIADLLRIAYGDAVHLLRLQRVCQGNVI